MDVIEFFGELKNMTMDCTIGCDHCPMSIANNGYDIKCGEFIRFHSDDAIKIVERWKYRIPTKCRQVDALELFPGLPIDSATGIVDVSPCDIDTGFGAGGNLMECRKNDISCDKCMRGYWTEVAK